MNLPTYDKIRSGEEMKQYYKQALQEIESLKQRAQLANGVTKMGAKQLQEKKELLNAAKRKLKELTKKEMAHENAKKATMYSGGATVAITMLYQAWHVVGFPGGRSWMVWWEHEAIYGAMCWALTVLLGVAFKAGKD